MQWIYRLLIIFALLVIVIDASPLFVSSQVKRVTNAERLKRGLAPAPPVFKRVLPGRSLTPTRSNGKRNVPSPSPSPRPSPTLRPTSSFHAGRIEVRDFTGTTYGYIKNTPTGVSGVTTGRSVDALAVSFSTTPGIQNSFDITATNATFPAPSTVGGVGDVSLAPSSPTAAVFNVTESTPAGAPHVPGSSGQSAIWIFDTRLAQIRPQWVNADGSKPETLIGLDTANNKIFLTGSIDLFNEAFPESPLVEVEFFLVQPPFL